MAGTDIRDIPGYQDANAYHDHSFYGNGCLQEEVQGGVSYSYETCSTRVIGTYMDAEYQDIGVYYNYQATSAGSGASLNTDNANIPDTFCPLGWQMSYGGTGGDYYDKSRSWNYFLNAYSIASDTPGSNKIRSYPISYIYTGLLHMATGTISEQANFAIYHSATISDRSGTFRFKINSNSIWSNTDVKAISSPVRCVNFLASLHRRHGGRNEYTFSRFRLYP